ncbi:restriction endonuclease subunit S [Campylobacter sp. RM16189]|uniref:restriction endonuclease subunit S n=1 Tax=Campylobacter sp. RM16189 TaxID=1705726 RepID=UPI001B8B8CC9|nr:restriction endonuclease subunit S [Campylobacter sp. RM16189]
MNSFKNLPSGWRVVRLGDVAEKVSTKNKDSFINLVLSNSATNGIVVQNEYFDKDIANKNNIQDYYIVDYGDFVYNPRISINAPTGPINRNLISIGIVSPLYTVFRVEDEKKAKFLSYFFKSIFWYNQVKSVANYGARHDRINITDKDFFSLEILLPPIDEQEKIAEILSTWDRAINLTAELIKSKKEFKKGLMQNLLTTKIRLPNFNDEWQETKLGEILTEHKLKSDGKSDVYSVSVHVGIINQIEYLGRSFAAQDTLNYNLVKPFDIVYTKSPTGNFPYGIIKQNFNGKNVIVSPLYGVFTPINRYLGAWLHFYFESSIRTKNYLQTIIQKGAKNTINISNATFLSKKILIPIALKEQQKIAEILTACDDEIKILENKLESLKTQKQGLMQNLLTGKVRT